MKQFLKKIFEPKKFIGFLAFNLSMGSLIYVFALHLEESFLAYIAYLLSTYALIIFCIWFYKACKFRNNLIKEKSKMYKIYHQNQKRITKISMLVSLSLNFVYGAFKLTSGIYYNSVWFITFAIYYLLLCMMKILLIPKKNERKNLKRECQKLKHTGIILLFLDVILIGMIILITHHDQTIIYPGYFIYIVAMYDFYLIITAIINVIKYRKEKNPIVVASKYINLTVAMISMISLEVAMIYQFGSNDSSFKLIMTAITGFVVCIVNSFMAIYTIWKSSQWKRWKERKESIILK